MYRGTPEAIRTPDPQLRRLLLYPAELRAHEHFFLLDDLFSFVKSFFVKNVIFLYEFAILLNEIIFRVLFALMPR